MKDSAERGLDAPESELKKDSSFYTIKNALSTIEVERDKAWIVIFSFLDSRSLYISKGAVSRLNSQR